MLRSTLFCLAVIAAAGPARPAPAAEAENPVTLIIGGADFQFHGDWFVSGDHGVTMLTTHQPASLPAATAIAIPRPGRYRLWVCSRDFPADRPGIRNFRVSIGGQRSDKVFGKSGIEGFSWEEGGWFDLKAGPVLICLDQATPFARAQGIILTTDLKLKPAKPVGPGMRPTGVLALPAGASEIEDIPPVMLSAGRPLATLSNAHIQLDFMPARRGEQDTVAASVKVRSGDRWVALPQDLAAEGYFALCAPADAKLSYAGFYPMWKRDIAGPVSVEAGGVSIKTVPGRTTSAMWDAGKRHRFIPSAARAEQGGVRIDFHPTPAGRLEALWTLPPDQHAAQVTLSFTPAADGQAALGYELFLRRDLSQVAELLQPMMFQRHRLPERNLTLLDNVAPTPLSLVQPAGAPASVLALVADPSSIPFGWPDGTLPHCALGIKDRSGKVQPSIWGPVIGTPEAQARAGRKFEMRFRIVLQAGDWYAGFRSAVDEVFAVRDYRSNARTSLSDAALNMIDLLMDDQHGGWWERAKSFYQIETKNGGTQPSPMMFLSLYRLTGDAEMYRKRALPAIEFMLSRDGPHFSPVPDDTGPYPAGSMKGPVKLYGTTAFGGLWELTGRRTPALGAIALPESEVRSTAGYSHAQEFDEWLARYLLTKDKKDLDRARELADAYIRGMMASPPKKDLGPTPFFFIHFTPDWEGLLWMYEVTKEPRYLDAAAFGARQLMTGLWCHPQFPAGEVVIHPGGQYMGDGLHQWWRGADRYRLGWPRKPGDTPEKKVPAWLVSSIGLGFEQPSTVRASGPARLIYQMYWAPHFLRLYRYTGDKAFLTCARNAVVGRFANYPGYYVTGLTDLPLKPDYPMTGPDVSSIYYHHIAPHLAWTIDYLVSEAEMLSDGRIRFPALRQNGYAYFDSRIYGHAPGNVFDDDQAWLLFRRGLVSLDNPQINCLLAHSPSRLHIMLTNQSQEAQEVRIDLSRPKLGLAPGGIHASLRVGASSSEIRLTDGARLSIPARGLAVLSVDDVKIDAPPRVRPPASPSTSEPIQVLKDGDIEVRAAAIQSDPGPWHAYIWLTASPSQAKSAKLNYAMDGTDQKDAKWQTIPADQYPCEFAVLVPDEKTRLRFRIDITHSSGRVSSTPEAVIGIEPRGGK